MLSNIKKPIGQQIHIWLLVSTISKKTVFIKVSLLQKTRLSSTPQLGNANTSFSFLGKMVPFEVTTLSPDSPGGEPLHVMPLPRKDIPLLRATLGFGASIHGCVLRGQLKTSLLPRPLAATSFLSAIEHRVECHVLFCSLDPCRSVPSLSSHGRVQLCIRNTALVIVFGSSPTCKTIQETGEDIVDRPKSCVFLFHRIPPFLLTLPLVFRPHYLSGFQSTGIINIKYLRT